MTSAPPILTTYDGEAFVPKNARLADRYFVVGEEYPLVVHEARSLNSHNHYFATLTELWRNLPEDDADQFPTMEHLRKWCLIKAGYADERSIVCASKAEAQRVAAFVKPMDEFAVVVCRDAVVKVFTAQSQSMKAMGAKAFQASKEAVLGIASEMVGVAPEQAADNARSAA
jgi:hypothetical protein